MPKHKLLLGLATMGVPLLMAAVSSAGQPAWSTTRDVVATACYQQTSVNYLAPDGSMHSVPSIGDATITHWSRSADGSDDLTTTSPPLGFNPRTADARWLPVFGIPARPSDISAAQQWDQLWDRIWTFEQPADMCPTAMRANFAGYANNRIWAGVVAGGGETSA
jgi:hypothetical protein